jgi:hypothetical protein
MKSIFAGLVLILLAGCATQHSAGILKESEAASAACSKTLSETDAGRIVYGEIISFNQSSPNRFELMSSKSKLSSEQKNALRTFLQGVSQCRQLSIDGYMKVDMRLANARTMYSNKMDAVYIALLDDKFSIGDANVAYAKATQEANNDFSAIQADDEARRQRNAAIMMPLLMQQNAINAQNQQNLYNQQMQNIRRNSPTYMPPVNTTCQAVGNQINCISR